MDQLVTLNSELNAYGSRHDHILGSAVSLLLADYPVQFALTDSQILQLLRHAFDPVGDNPHLPSEGSLTPKALLESSDLRKKYFPKKRHPAANTKASVTLRYLLIGMDHANVLELAGPILNALAGRATDDQTCCALLYEQGMRASLGAQSVRVAVAMILQPDNAKGLSTALKALGANSSLLGARLCEGNTMLGRAVGMIDLKKEAAQRADPAWVAKNVLTPDMSALEEVIDRILDEELAGRDIEYEELDDFWHSRWQWCVNGSHSRAIDTQLGVKTADLLPGINRVYRRMFAEAAMTEPISSWDGYTHVSTSAKLEHGKTRAIFACDTRSYFAFQHLLGPVSAAWLDKRVILDPGKLGHLGMASRVLRARGGGGINLMLDYDDFNSHHRTDVMQLLIRRVAAKTGYPAPLAETLERSFEMMHTFAGGEDFGTMKGTLASGHRGTSFINSVLNAAYIRLAVGEHFYKTLPALHVGDDVYLSPATFADAGLILEKCHSSGCRMNPSKQSVGIVGAEFLRMGIRQHHSTGYLARAIASTVSGNWVNEAQLSPEEALTTACTTTRSLTNRSNWRGYPTLLAPSVCNITGMKRRLCRELLAGGKAIEGSPVFTSDGTVRTVAIEPNKPEDFSSKLDPVWPRNATNDYLAHTAKPIEQMAMMLTKSDVKSAMLLSSYKRAVASDTFDNRPRLKTRSLKPLVPVGADSATALLTRPAKEGVLTPYPVLPLLKSRMTRVTVATLVQLAGGDPNATDLNAEAWGSQSQSKLVQGVMSFSDAASLGGRTKCGVLYSTYPTYM